jgi:RimJ/RimL family protein N-acetyltransferase
VPDLTTTVDLLMLRAPVLGALLDGDLQAASRAAGVELPPSFLDDGALWGLRLGQLESDPASAPWLIRAIVAPGGAVVGHGGYHGPPDERGMVEIGYAVDEPHRRRGYGRATLAGLLAYATDHGVGVARASVAPANDPSLALIRAFGFVHIGEQWDDMDGLELVFERPLAPDGS